MAAYINRIATAVPPHDVHHAFVRFARSLLSADRRARVLFERMADKAQIEHRYSSLKPAASPDGKAVDDRGFYTRGGFPGTAERMRAYEDTAPDLAVAAVENLGVGADLKRVSHVIVTTCTGFSAPGIDLQLIDRCGLDPSVERTVIGFMGCYAAINALKLARHIVRSEPASRVLIVNLELCTLHLQETLALEQVLSFLVFGDGCAACLVTSEPSGLALDSFRAVLVPETRSLITWRIRDAGFDMVLSGQVPGAIGQGLRQAGGDILAGAKVEAFDLWAVHPGGRSVLDAVEHGLQLPPQALATSRDILRRYGNMSSATVMFVLGDILKDASPGQRGCALSFGPGLTAETMLFHVAG